MPIGVYERRRTPRTREKEYKTWTSMRARCNTPSNSNYRNYGGRGIKVCERWSDFDAFLRDVGRIPAGMQLDRIDNNGDYSPENVRVVSATENHRNTARSKKWFIDGVEYPSRPAAATALRVGVTTISCWCDGYIGNKGKIYPPRHGCYSELKYQVNTPSVFG